MPSLVITNLGPAAIFLPDFYIEIAGGSALSLDITEQQFIAANRMHELEAAGEIAVVSVETDVEKLVSTLRRTNVFGTINGSGSDDLPGPTQTGMVRVYEALQITSLTSGAAAASVVAKLQPNDSQLQQTLSGSVTNRVTIPPLFAGETVNIANGGANGISYATSYVDMYIPNAKPIRLKLTDSLQPLIPAASPGRKNKLFIASSFPSGSISLSTAPLANLWFNADSIPHSVEIVYGGVSYGRSNATNAGLAGLINGPLIIEVTDVPLEVRLLEAISSNNPVINMVYLEDEP